MNPATAFAIVLVGCAFHSVRAQSWNWFDASSAAQVECWKGDGLWSLSEAVLEVESSTGKQVLMAMNGGMFHASGQPVGLHVHRGVIQTPMNLDSLREGNFFLLPNGVFGIDDDGAFQILESRAASQMNWLEATQSGPMLLIDGEVHPAFRPASTNLRVRNGVGIRDDGSVVFGISSEPVTFHATAMAFKDQGCVHALYLDGVVSKMYRPGDPTSDDGGAFGVVLVALGK